MNQLSLLRNELGISQTQAAETLGVSLRTYQRYEKKDEISEAKLNSYKVVLTDKFGVTEEKGLLTISGIRSVVVPILIKHKIDLCILFGSYAKGKATEKSDVDILVKTNITGLKFFGVVEELRIALHKKVDLITTEQLVTSQDLLEEILKYGIKIYDQSQGQEAH